MVRDYRTESMRLWRTESRKIILGAIVIVTAAIGSILLIRDEGAHQRAINRLPPEQQAIVRKIQENRISNEELNINVGLFVEAKEYLEKAQKYIQAQKHGNALDCLINAKGCIEKINPKVFDTKQIKGQILAAEKELAMMISEGKGK